MDYCCKRFRGVSLHVAQPGREARAALGPVSHSDRRSLELPPGWAQCLTRTGNRRQRAYSLLGSRPPVSLGVVVLTEDTGEVPRSMTDAVAWIGALVARYGPTTVAVVVTPVKADGVRREPSEEAPTAPPSFPPNSRD